MSRFLIYFSVLILLFSAFGCSGGYSVMPDSVQGDGLTSEAGNSLETEPSFLGLYQVDIDTTNMAVDITPVRASA